MATFPTDRFDNLPDNLERIGAHRGPRIKGHRWVAFAWAALATGILVVVGLFVLSSVDASFKLTLPGGGGSTTSASPAPSVSPTPAVKPVTDPTTIASRNITITILNGTAVSDLDGKASTKLTNAKWTVGASGPSSATNIKQTVVYYSTSANKDVAEGIQLALGTGTIQLSDAYVGAPITVVVGSDFKG
jgi:hypothetical protein